MFEITVKTLNSANHKFNVEDQQITVKQFKELICPKVGIPVPEQRLIYRGRVLQDDKSVSEYGLQGNTLHLVQRLNSTTTNETPQAPPVTARHNQQQQDFENGGGGILFGQSGSPNRIGNLTFTRIPRPTIENQGTPNHTSGPARRNSRHNATTRLQLGNNMLNNASTLLKNLEEDGPEVSEVGGGGSSTVPVSLSNNLDSILAQPNLIPSVEQEVQIGAPSPMNVDMDPNSPFSRMISQVSNAAYMATVGRGERPNLPSSSSASANINYEATGPRRTRSLEPRVSEMASALEDLSAFHDRLSPYLRYLQRILRENRNYDETEETESMQYIFNNISSIMHLLAHSYHAFSDLKCDFSLDANNRRLHVSSSMLVEQAPSPSPPRAQAASMEFLRSNMVPHQMQPPALPTTTFRNLTSRSSTPPTSNNPNVSLGNYVANLFNQARAGQLTSGEGVLRVGGSNQSRDISDEMRAQLLEMSHQEVYRISIIRSSERPQRITSTSNQQQPQNPSNNGQQRTRVIEENNRPISSFDPFLSCNSSHLHNSAISVRGNRTQQQQQKPKNLKKHIKIDNSQQENENSTEEIYNIHNNGDFFGNLFAILKSSNIIEAAHPIIKDIIQNYLMRGSNVKNIAHVKECARFLSKNVIQFLKSITNKIDTRDMLVDFDGTYDNLLIKLFSDVVRLTLECESGPIYRLSIIQILENFLLKMFAIFKVTLRNPNIPEIFSNSIIEKFFSGMSIPFKSYASSQFELYFKAFLTSKSKYALAPPQISYRYLTETNKESGPNSTEKTSENLSTSFSMPSTSSSTSSAGLVRAGSSTMDVDSDDSEHVEPRRKIPRSDSPNKH